jgi:phosphoribosylglycinamide formyltransferase 1
LLLGLDFCDVIQMNVAQQKKIGILLSGRGSNFLAIADSIDAGRLKAEIAIVISNRADAAGLEAAKARRLNARLIPSKGRTREEHDAAVIAALQDSGVDLVCLAGYMRLLSPEFVRAFPNRILNIHPSLLPAFPGLEAQRQAIEFGVKVSGCTVHFVDEYLDHGPIILQKPVAVQDDDDEHSLAARILEQEHLAYSEAIDLVLSGEVEVHDRRVVRTSGRNQKPKPTTETRRH